MKYKAIIFDVTDTLVDYHPNLATIYGDKVRSLGLEVTEKTAREMNKAIYWAYFQQVLKEQNGAPYASSEEISMLWNKAALSCVEVKNEMRETYLHLLSCMPKVEQEMRVIPGVIEVLEVLGKKYHLAIVSNHHTWLVDRLRELKLYDYFESVVISEIVGIEKPDTRIMEIALHNLNLTPADCLYVGDHPLDVLCSKKAGMDCAWIVGDWEELDDSIPFKEDYRIKNVSELKDLL